MNVQTVARAVREIADATGKSIREVLQAFKKACIMNDREIEAVEDYFLTSRSHV